MVSKRENLLGLEFDRWTVIGLGAKRLGTRKSYWICECKCGNIKEVKSDILKNRQSRSCGCRKLEIFKKNCSTPVKNKLHQEFGRLTVIAYAGKKRGKHYWRARCKCGVERDYVSNSLGRNTNSCGCLHDDTRYKKHGMRRSKVYNTYHLMMRRCYKENSREYKNYGGRGISVCEDWLGENGFIRFLRDIGEPASSKLSLDRINNEGNYTKSNCRWATQKQQTRNKRNNVWLEHNGEKMCLSDWANRIGVTGTAITERLKEDGPWRMP